MSLQTCYQDSRSQQQRSAMQPQRQLHNCTSTLISLQPRVVNLSGQTLSSSTWSEMTTDSESDIDECDSDSETDSIYCTDFNKTIKQLCEIKTDEHNFISTSGPLVDLPISREGMVPEDFMIPTRRKIATEQEADTELQQLQNYKESKQYPSADELAALSCRMKAFLQLFD